MFRVSEFSVTAVSPHTALSSSSFAISFPGLRSRISRTRNAFGSTGQPFPALVSEELPLRAPHIREMQDSAEMLGIRLH